MEIFGKEAKLLRTRREMGGLQETRGKLNGKPCNGKAYDWSVNTVTWKHVQGAWRWSKRKGNVLLAHNLHLFQYPKPYSGH